jgi:hypothetical protein
MLRTSKGEPDPLRIWDQAPLTTAAMAYKEAMLHGSQTKWDQDAALD